MGRDGEDGERGRMGKEGRGVAVSTRPHGAPSAQEKGLIRVRQHQTPRAGASDAGQNDPRCCCSPVPGRADPDPGAPSSRA